MSIKTELKEPFNDLLLDIFELSNANGSISAVEQRKFAEYHVANIGKARERVAQLFASELEKLIKEKGTTFMDRDGSDAVRIKHVQALIDSLKGKE